MTTHSTPEKTFFTALAVLLRAAPRPLLGVTAGFDGFVDEMITVVAERQGLEQFTAVPDIATFGGLLTKAAGHSSLREIVVTATHPGGCAVNLGDGLASLGVPVDAFATLGQPAHPAFAETTAKFQSCHSWGPEPGRTLAFEFPDGKLMFSAVRQLADFTPAHVEKLLADGHYAAACRRARLIALTDWTLYPHMTAVWRLLLEKVYVRLKHHPAFFIDLVDPSSRSEADIRAMLEMLPCFEPCGPLTLGLNGNEANILARVLGLSPVADGPTQMLLLAAELRRRLKISEVVIHQPRFAVTASEAEKAAMNGPFCAQPKKSTGAGDRFNAGFCLGVLLGLDPRRRLALGCGASGFFVRQARSASLPELADFLERDFAAAETGVACALAT
jgi:sugar/nucleoside kinase (ribokinase family)